MDELRTRLVPWAQIEVTYARNRPHAERSPWPKVGDAVWYRRYDWDRDPRDGARVEPVIGTVIAVQDLDDREDPNLWHQIKNVHGQPLAGVHGGPARQAAPDPWPWVDIQLADKVKDDGSLMRHGEVVRTWESRMRGSAGWLPLGYRQRPERWRLPSETALVERPPLVTPTQTGVILG